MTLAHFSHSHVLCEHCAFWLRISLRAGELRSACPTRTRRWSAFCPGRFWKELEHKHVCVCWAIRKRAPSSMAFLFLVFLLLHNPRLAFLHIFLKSWQIWLGSNYATCVFAFPLLRLPSTFIIFTSSRHSSVKSRWKTTLRKWWVTSAFSPWLKRNKLGFFPLSEHNHSLTKNQPKRIALPLSPQWLITIPNVLWNAFIPESESGRRNGRSKAVTQKEWWNGDFYVLPSTGEPGTMRNVDFTLISPGNSNQTALKGYCESQSTGLPAWTDLSTSSVASLILLWNVT